MNKQELIMQLESFQESENPNTWKSGYNAGISESIDLVEQLDEPQKVKVPKFVAEWFEKHKHRLGYSIWKLVGESHKSYTTNKLDMRHWILQEPNNPIETLIRMKDGYEVEEEPRWVVQVGNLYFCGWEDTTAQFVMNTMLGEEELIIKYKNEGTASAVAKNLGGTVEKVEVRE